MSDHDVRFVLCHDDGTEITDVPPNKVEEVSERCRRSRVGLVKRIETPRAETPPPAT